MLNKLKVQDIRNEFIRLKAENEMSDNGTYEIVNATFVADEQAIFGKVNEDYIQRELTWYLSKERNISAMPPPVPEIWKQVSGHDGSLNSNYGWCIFSEENNYQYANCLSRLAEDKASRQAIMIYTRPEIHSDFCKNGMSDFICTNTVQLLIRDNKLIYIVSMRSNDAVFGYKNDKPWHDYVFDKALTFLAHIYPNLEKGEMFWNASSLHVYPRHFNLI